MERIRFTNTADDQKRAFEFVENVGDENCMAVDESLGSYLVDRIEPLVAHRVKTESNTSQRLANLLGDAVKVNVGNTTTGNSARKSARHYFFLALCEFYEASTSQRKQIQQDLDAPHSFMSDSGGSFLSTMDAWETFRIFVSCFGLFVQEWVQVLSSVRKVFAEAVNDQSQDIRSINYETTNGIDTFRKQ